MNSPHSTSPWKAWLLLAIAFWMGLIPGWAVMSGAGNYAYDADNLWGGAARLSTPDRVVQDTSTLVETNNRTDGGACVPDFTYEAAAISSRFDASGALVSGAEIAPISCILSGEQWDQDLGLYYNRARYLNTASGRFWSLDSYEGGRSDPGSLHKYLYASTNPVTYTDPSGYETTIPGLSTVNTVLGNIVRIAIPTIARLNTATLYNIYRGTVAAEKMFTAIEYVGVGVGIVGLVASGADSMAGALLNNAESVTDGPYPQQFQRGGHIERIANPNLGGNVSIIDDLDADGVGTSLRSHNIPSGEKALLEAIQNDVREVSKAPTSRIYGTTRDGRWVDYRPGTVKGTALVVAIPENDIRITLSPSFRNALKAYRDTYRTAIQVVPVKGWRR